MNYAVIIIYFGAWLGLNLFGIHRLFLLYLYIKMKRNKTATYTGSDIPCNFPYVTVQLPIYNEEKVVDRLIAHVSKLNYPRNSLQIQILDDSTDITSEIALQKVHDLILQGIDVEYIHRKNRSGYKAGALKNGLDSAKGELILILDSDFICPESLLLNLVGHFSDSRLGMVQARWGHINKDYSLLTKIQAILLDGHFIIEQAVRATHGLFFNFNGSGGIWRKSCILDAGGWQCDTLTEDLDLSYRAFLKGWKFLFLQEITVPGELPIEIKSFKTQQYRWTKGATQTARKLLIKIWESKIPLKTKMETSLHLFSNLNYISVFCLFYFFLPMILIKPDFPGYKGKYISTLIDFPIFFIPTISLLVFYILSQREIDSEWFKTMAYFPFIFFTGIGLAFNNTRAIMSGLLKISSPFIRTPKYNVENKGTDQIGLH